MSSDDQNKASGKRGPRSRKGEPRSRKPATPPNPKPEHEPNLQQSARQLIDATIAKPDVAPIELVAPVDTAASIDAVAPVESVSIDAIAPVDTISIDAVAPANIVSIGAVAPAETGSIDAVAPANIVSIDAIAPAETGSIDAVALGVTFSIGAVAPVDSVSNDFRTIASAYGDYARKSCEQTLSFLERLKDVRSLEQAMEMQAEFAAQAYESFVAESRRICEVYRDLARQSFRPMVSLIARAVSAPR